MPRSSKQCPCGSGKPFDLCCRARKVLYSFEQARWRRAGQDLRRSLGHYADQPSFAWDAARAQDLYLGCLAQHFDREDDFTMERCFEWFIFDYRLYGGKTVVETFREENFHNLSGFELTLAREWARSRISLYEVAGVIPGEGLLIKELLGRKELRVHDISAATEIDVGSILLMRVLKVGEEYEFSTSGLALPGEYSEKLLRRLYRDREEYYCERNMEPRGWGTYLKERAHKVNAFVMDLGFSSARAGRSTCSEGLERSIVLPVDDWQDVLKNLKQSESFRLIRVLRDSAGVFRQATAALLGEPRSLKTLSLRPVVGHLILTRSFMVLTADTPREMKESSTFMNILCSKAELGNLSREQGGVYDQDPDAAFYEGPSKGLRRERDKYPWPRPGYAAVAGSVQDGLDTLGYSPKQQKGALKLWYDYCSKENPSIRKAAVWTAAVIYAFTRLEMEKGLKQQDLAGRYGVAPSTISSRFRQLCQALQLVPYDKRYSTKKPQTGLKENNPLLTRK